MVLDKIYQPIKKELKEIGSLLSRSLEGSSHKSILEMNRYLLESPGKRIRPALVILSAHTSKVNRSRKEQDELIAIGAAVELIHIASLVHDDIIDNASLRHNKPTINAKWGNEVSIALGDYLYSKAFELISSCNNQEVLGCLSKAMAAMCEGELTQVKERDNTELKKREYLIIVKKKTASLIASCCRAGAALAGGKFIYKQALTNYGLNFGIAFQVIDDYLDLTSTTGELGKPAGLDLRMGELTLPLLFLSEGERKRLLEINKEPKLFSFAHQYGIYGRASENNSAKQHRIIPLDLRSRINLDLVRQSLDKSGVLAKTRAIIDNYLAKARENLSLLRACEYKESLENLTNVISLNNPSQASS